MEKMSAPRRPTQSTPRRVSAYDELYNKALRHARQNGLDTSRQAIERVVRMGLDARRNSLVECPACSQRRRNPRFEFCVICAQMAYEEDARQAKTGAPSPSIEESERRSTQITARQNRAVAKELWKLYLQRRLPPTCRLLVASQEKLVLQTVRPNGEKTKWILHLDEAPVRPINRSTPPAPIIELTLEQIDAGWDEIAA